MPAQAARANLIAYGLGDQAPSTPLTLCDGAGQPIDLSTATSVTLRIAYASHSHYYAPYTVVNEASPTTIDLDQVTNKGVVHYSPASGDTDVAGEFHVQANILWNDGKPQTVPNLSYIPMTVTTPVGGPSAL